MHSLYDEINFILREITRIIVMVGCFKSKVNIFFGILACYIAPIIVDFIIYFIDELVLILTKSKKDKLLKDLVSEIKKEFANEKIDIKWKIKPDNSLIFVISGVFKDQIYLDLEYDSEDKLKIALSKLIQGVNKTKDKRIYDILKKVNKSEVILHTKNKLLDYIDSVEPLKGINSSDSNEVVQLINDELELLLNIPEDSLANKHKSLNSLYDIFNLELHKSEIDFLDMIYSENIFISKDIDEDISLISVYLMERILQKNKKTSN